MQKELNERNKRELQALKDKYEQMLHEMRSNANSDKEFLQMELQKRITELEQQIVDLRASFADEKAKLEEAKRKLIADFEAKIAALE